MTPISDNGDGAEHRRIERLRRVRALLDRVLDAPKHERSAILAAIDDPEVAADVREAMGAEASTLPTLMGIGEPPEPSNVATGAKDGDDDSDEPQDQRMPSPLGKGDRVGRYLVLDNGQGGLASVVHKARDEATSNTVAYKLLRPMASSLDRHQFDRQRLILEAIDHPRIPTAIDHGQVANGPARGLPFVVMPWVDGVHFSAWAKHRPWREAVRLLADVLDIVGAAHTAKVVHRDLTPSNILVRDERAKGGKLEVWVVDFGIARLTGGPLKGMTPTASGTRGGVGTTGYMAPEQFVGGGSVGPSTDFYAVGCVLYEALAGTKPHVEDPRKDTSVDIANRRSQGPPVMPEGIDAQIATILRLALATKPEDRGYKDAAELATDLRRAADGLPILKRPPGTARRASLWVRRNPALASMAAALAIVLIGASIAGAIQTDRIANARDEAQAAQAAAERRFESLRRFTSFVLESHDEALRGHPELITARRDLTEQAALAMAAIDAQGPTTLEQALHQAELWLLLSEIGLNNHGRSLWSAEQAHEAAERAIELMAPWEDSDDPRVRSIRARGLLRAKTNRLVPRLERSTHFQEVAHTLEPVYQQSPDSAEVVVAYAEAVLRVGLGHAWHEDGHERSIEQLRRSRQLAEKAVRLAPGQRRSAGMHAFILLHLGGQLREGDAADRREALIVLQEAVEAYDRLAQSGDSYLVAQSANARAAFGWLLIREGYVLPGITSLGQAIQIADKNTSRDPGFDRARRASMGTRNRLITSLLAKLDSSRMIGVHPVIEPILRDFLLDVAVSAADEAVIIQIRREQHLRSTAVDQTLKDEAHYLAGLIALRQRVHALRAILRGEPWVGWSPS